jgi:hypothetical protein
MAEGSCWWVILCGRQSDRIAMSGVDEQSGQRIRTDAERHVDDEENERESIENSTNTVECIEITRLWGIGL